MHNVPCIILNMVYLMHSDIIQFENTISITDHNVDDKHIYSLDVNNEFLVLPILYNTIL